MSDLLIFYCPGCGAVMKSPRHLLGETVRCSGCGAELALVGDGERTTPQPASYVAHAAANPSPRPVSEAQREALLRLGVTEARIGELDRDGASETIDALIRAERERRPLTARQRAALAGRGATPEQIDAIRTQGEASALLTSLTPPPTKKQLAYLKRLGAAGAELKALRNAADAALLIDALKSRRNR